MPPSTPSTAATTAPAGMARRVGAAGTHHRVGVDMDQLTGRRPDAQDGIDIALRMDARELLDAWLRGATEAVAGPRTPRRPGCRRRPRAAGPAARDGSRPVSCSRNDGWLISSVIASPLARFDDLRQSRPQPVVRCEVALFMLRSLAVAALVLVHGAGVCPGNHVPAEECRRGYPISQLSVSPTQLNLRGRNFLRPPVIKPGEARKSPIARPPTIAWAT